MQPCLPLCNAMGREFKYGGTIGGNNTLVGETLETGWGWARDGSAGKEKGLAAFSHWQLYNFKGFLKIDWWRKQDHLRKANRRIMNRRGRWRKTGNRLKEYDIGTYKVTSKS